MKINIFYITPFLTTFCVEAVAIVSLIPGALAYADAGDSECYAPGGSCTTLKRAAEAAANAMAEPEANPGLPHHDCFLPGQKCSKARRDALALAEAIAEAAAITDPANHPKAKRNAHAAAEAVVEIEVNGYNSTQDDIAASDEACDQPGGLCHTVKRAAKAAADAMAEPEANPGLPHHDCFLPGQKCSKAKRALEALGGIVSNTL